MPSQPGHKRRLVIQWLTDLLMVPADIPKLPGGNEMTANNDLSLTNPPTHRSPLLSTVLDSKSQTDRPSSAVSEEPLQPDRQIPPTVPQPVAWLKDLDIELLRTAVWECYLPRERRKSLAEITIFGDEFPDRIKPIHGTDPLARPGISQNPGQSANNVVDDSSSSDLGVPLNKGFTTLFDTGADVSIVTLKTLRRLQKGYTKLSNLHPDQQHQMGLQDFSGQRVNAGGLVALLWYLDSFPGAIFNTTFFVVDGDGANDLIIGRDFYNAVVTAVQEEQKHRNMGPVKRFIKDTMRHGQVALLRQVSTRNLRGSRPHVEEVQNRAGGQGSAVHLNTGR